MNLPGDFVHGEVVRWRRVGGLKLAETAYAPRLRVPEHAHARARFVVVLRGSFVEEVRGAAAVRAAGAVTFRPAGEPHGLVVSERGAVCLVVEMEEAWLARARAESPLVEDPAEFRGGLLGHLARRLYGEFRLRDDVSRLAIESLVLGLLAEAWRRHARVRRAPPQWLEQARDLLQRSFAERLDISSIARAVGVHPVHFARVFRAWYRSTPGEYVRHLRLDFACQQLAVSSGPLAEIALAAGFCDQSHFSRDFKRHTGMTPAEFRALCRKR